jgi:hypothetical protein
MKKILHFRVPKLLYLPSGLLVLTTLIGLLLGHLWPKVATEPSKPLPPAAKEAIEQGKSAASQKLWTVAINYFDSARKAAPLSPEPLYYLGLAEAQIPGREIRAICWLEAYLALVPHSTEAGKVRNIILNELEVKARGNLQHAIDVLKDLATKQDFKDYSTKEEESIRNLSSNTIDPGSVPVAADGVDEAVNRWRAKMWIDFVDQRLGGVAFTDFDRAIKTAEAGREVKSLYPTNEEGEPFYHPALPLCPPNCPPSPTVVQQQLGDTFNSVLKVAQDILDSLGDALKQRNILGQFQPKLFEHHIVSVLGPFDSSEDFRNGWARVRHGQSSFIIDRQGSELHLNDDLYLTSYGFSDDRLRVGIKDGFPEELPGQLLPQQKFKWGYIDKSGTLTIPTVWDEARDFSQGLAAVKIKDVTSQAFPELHLQKFKWGYIDKSGKLAIPAVWDSARDFSEGLAAVRMSSGWGYIDKSGTLTIPAVWDYVSDYYSDFSEGLAAVRMSSGWGYIDKSGKLAIPAVWDSVRDFSEGLAAVAKSSKWGYIDKSGKLIIPAVWNEAYHFSDGLAAVLTGDNWGFVDKHGEIVIPAKWGYAALSEIRFREGLAFVSSKGDKPRQALIDQSGHRITGDGFPIIHGYSEHMIRARTSVVIRDDVHDVVVFLEISP